MCENVHINIFDIFANFEPKNLQKYSIHYRNNVLYKSSIGVSPQNQYLWIYAILKRAYNGQKCGQKS